MIRIREIVKTAVFLAWGNPPLLKRRLEQLAHSPAVTILNLHQVAPEDESNYHPLPPVLFEELLRFLNRSFAVVTFSEMHERTSRPKVILPFDDGYRDFVDFAVPLMSKYGLRANLNIIPHCAETGLPPLIVLAEDFLGKAPTELRDALRVPEVASPLDKRQFGKKLLAFIKNRSHSEQRLLEDQLLPQFFAWNEFKPTPMMTSDQCRHVSAIHEVGGHSYAHTSMDYETDDNLRADVTACQSWFGRRIGRDMIT